MHDPSTLQALLAYSEAANRRLLDAADALDDAQLDAPFEMGPGTLRSTLAHIIVGEAAWLERWRQTPGFTWSSIAVPSGIEEMRRLLEQVIAARGAFLATLDPSRLDVDQVYLDSTAGPFVATLGEQMLQGVVHSIHHRAQAVNMLRRVGGPSLDVDFMYATRRPVPG